MENLFGNIRALARADEAEMASMPADFVSPLSPLERDGIVSAIMTATGAVPAQAPAPVRAPAANRPATRRGWRFWPALLVPVAAAAALFLVLRPVALRQLPDLPGYEVAANGGLKEFRGGGNPVDVGGTTASVQRVMKQTDLVVIARPATAVEGPVAVRMFLVQAGNVREIEPQAQVAPSGAFELRVRPGAVTGATAGQADLRVLIGRPAAVSAVDPDAARDAARRAQAEWLTVPLEVAPN